MYKLYSCIMYKPYKLYSSGGAWLDVRELYSALQHVRREGGCKEVREDMVPQHHPAYRAPPDTSQHHPTPPGLPMVLASQTSLHPPSGWLCEYMGHTRYKWFKKCWFNFCHSSTRFFVEETFGRWKNRWRFLLDPSHVDHKLTSQMIYASAVLHNFCTVHMRAGGDLDGCMAGGAWKQFFTEAQVQLCPTCKRRGKDFCIHQQPYRNGFLQQVALRRAPSEVRDQLCQKLWDEVCDGEGAWRVCDSDDSDEAERVRNVMHARAQQDAHAYELRV